MFAAATGGGASAFRPVICSPVPATTRSANRVVGLVGRLSAFRYYGGKSAISATGTGRWIAQQLPTDAQAYIEPFAGQLGVLLQRPPAKIEAANDINAWLVGWWRVVRDRGDELAAAVADTPNAEGEFAMAVAALREGFAGVDEFEQARLVTVLLWQSFGGVFWSGYGGSWDQPGGQTAKMAPEMAALKVQRLSARLRHVHLYNRDANRILEKWVGEPDALIYCDPPYADTVDHRYVETGFDRDRMADLLADASARCAVSGYGSEWDRLGWERHELAMVSPMMTAPGVVQDDRNADRVEVLWTNFEPGGQQALL